MKKEKIEILEEYEVVEENNQKAPLYIGYTPRLIVSIILIPILSIIAVIFLYKAFEVNDIVNIRYSEKSNSSYQVLGKDYNEVFPSEDGRWNVNDIDTIELIGEYNFQTNIESDMEFEYQMVADLLILEKNNPDKVFFEKKVELTELQKDSIEGKDSFTIHDIASLTYEEYNAIAKQYVESYGVETDSYLDFYLVVHYKTSTNNSYYLEGTSKPGITISLSKERIEVEEKEVDSDKRINKKPTIQLTSPGYLGLGVLAGLGAVVALSEAILLVCSTLDQRSVYDKTVDRFVEKHKKEIETIKKAIPKKKRKITRINTFKELLKV